MVPVTTKPYLNSFVLFRRQGESLHHFLLIKDKIKQYFTACLNDRQGCASILFPILCRIIRPARFVALRFRRFEPRTIYSDDGAVDITADIKFCVSPIQEGGF